MKCHFILCCFLSVKELLKSMCMTKSTNGHKRFRNTIYESFTVTDGFKCFQQFPRNVGWSHFIIMKASFLEMPITITVFGLLGFLFFLFFGNFVQITNILIVDTSLWIDMDAFLATLGLFDNKVKLLKFTDFIWWYTCKWCYHQLLKFWCSVSY